MVGLVSLMAGELIAFASFFTGQWALSAQHLDVTLAHAGALRGVLAAGFYLAVMAWVGLGLGAVIRHTAGSARAPARYVSVNRARRPRIGHARRARPARTTKSICQLPPGVSAVQAHYTALCTAAASRQIRPTHSPRGTADGLMNRSL